MHDTKPWYTSVTVWGAIVSVLASLLSLFKIRLDPQFQADLRDWLLAAATLAGGAAALWGRLRASRRILSPQTVETTVVKPRPQDWRMNAALPFALVSMLLLLSQSTGCSALRLPTADYVAADRATYQAVAPEYAAYVHADESLDDEERGRRDRTLETWDARIRSVEEGGGEGTEARRHGGTKGLPELPATPAGALPSTPQQ